MGFKDLREWINRLEVEGELKRIKTKVGWDGEIGGIIRKVHAERGPAILFENIRDYENTPSRRLFAASLSSRGRVALMLGMSKDASYKEIIQLLRRRLNELIKPIAVGTGPVKENIIKGDDVDLFQFPVPIWHPLDGGRYICTFGGVVTKDPETGEYNVGLYRGMIASRNKVAVNLVPSQHWGIHYSKYQRLGRAMPVAIVIGYDPAWPFVASWPVPHSKGSEYELLGAIREQPVELVKCETSDLEVPAFAEIVIEGSISPDPSTYETEGPFGEYTGFYGHAAKRPVVKVDCITHRNDAIFRGALEGISLGAINEDVITGFVQFSALIWNILESQGIPGVIDVVPNPWTIVKIRKTYQGQARHTAAALWGSRLISMLKVIIVVEEDVDIHNLREIQLAINNNVDVKRALVVYPMNSGSALDPSLSLEEKDALKYGAGLQDKLLIDATTDWVTHPIREEWGGRRYPPSCIELTPEVEALVQKRWKEYGF